MQICPILAICSGKGGVGKSTLSFALAQSLALKHYQIGLIDADIYGPSLHLLFKELKDLKPEEKGGKISPPKPEGIAFMSGAFFAPGGAFIRAPKAVAIIKSFFDSVDWGMLDLLIVDFPPGTGDIALTLFQEIYFDGALVITTPHTLSVEDAAKSACHLIHSGIPLLGVIENMSYLLKDGVSFYLFGQGGGEELSKLLNIPLLGSIPLFDQSQEGFMDRVTQAVESLEGTVKKLIEAKKNAYC